jgi:hypothetical protein
MHLDLYSTACFGVSPVLNPSDWEDYYDDDVDDNDEHAFDLDPDNDYRNHPSLSAAERNPTLR